MNRMDKFKGIPKLARITSWSPYLLPFSIGIAYGCSFYSNLNPIDLLIALIAISSSLSFGFGLNFYTDQDVDRLHDGKLKDIDLGKQPILSGLVSEKEAVSFCKLTFVMSFLGFFVNIIFGILIALNTVVLGIVYSLPPFRFKAKPVGDVAINVISGSILLFLAGIIFKEYISWIPLYFSHP